MIIYLKLVKINLLLCIIQWKCTKVLFCLKYPSDSRKQSIFRCLVLKFQTLNHNKSYLLSTYYNKLTKSHSTAEAHNFQLGIRLSKVGDILHFFSFPFPLRNEVYSWNVMCTSFRMYSLGH